MKNKRAVIDESLFYITGIVIIFLFFTGLMLSVFLLSASKSKQNIEEAKVSTLGTLTNFTFITTILIIIAVLFLIIISHLFGLKKPKSHLKSKKTKRSSKLISLA